MPFTIKSNAISPRGAIPQYVVVHEMLHLIEPTHSERFLGLMDRHYPTWREARAELNELPLTGFA
jgi:predicted metal-dependent hydrolase